jgi:hypothetical protein
VEGEQEIAARLGLGATSRLVKIIYSSKTKPVIYVIGFYRSERHSLFIRRLR